MVGAWLPDPPIGDRSMNDISAMSVTTVFFLDSDNDDQDLAPPDENTVENGGYQLLIDNDNSQHSDSFEEATSEESVEENQISEYPVLLNTEPQIDLPECSNADANEDAESANNTSRDIYVDYDQVRSVMANITLPPSAVPSWASTIPDSEWCTFLQDRIRVLQDQDKQVPELKNHSDRD